MDRTVIRRAFPLLQVKAADEAQGIFSGYLATYDDDLVGDRIIPGAFKKTLSELQNKQQNRASRYLLPILWGHDQTEPIGGFTVAREDSKGLYVEGELDLDIDLGRRAFSGMKKGYCDSLSIGYYVIKHGYKDGVRLLQEIQLLEGSVTATPANPAAVITSVKSEAIVLDVKRDGRALSSTPYLTEKGAALMSRFARTRQHGTAPSLPTILTSGKAVDFATTLAGLQAEDTLQEEWHDTFQAFVTSISNALWEARWRALGYASSDGADPADLISSSVEQFSAAVSDLAARSVAATFAPSLDGDGDSFEDVDAEGMSDYYGSDDYMARKPGSQKAGRVLSQANRDRMAKALDMIADGHKDLTALHAETEPASADDSSTGDAQPDGKDAATVTQDPAAQQQEEKGLEPGAQESGDTTPQATTETLDSVREQQIRDQIAALTGQLQKV